MTRLKFPNSDDAPDIDLELQKSSINLSVQILDDSYKRFVEQIRSLQTRAGVSLGILVATTSGLLVRFSKVLPQLTTVEQQRCLFAAAVSVCLLCFAVYCFVDAFFSESLPDVYNDDELLNSEDGLWLSTVQDLQTIRLEWLDKGIKELQGIVRVLHGNLRTGVITTLLGIAILIVMEVFIRYANPDLVF